MALNIKNPEVERLATEVARMAGETKTEAIRRSLLERRSRLTLRVDSADFAATAWKTLELEIWPLVPDAERGRRLAESELDDILGYGPHGV